MKLQFMSILGMSVLLAACCCDETPQPIAVVPCVDPTEVFATSVGDRVFFAFDKSDLTEDAKNTLRRQAEFLKKHPEISSVTLVGKCDERGSSAYNMALGERRAYAAYRFLVELGIEEKRLQTCSEGKENPVVVGHTEEAYRQNRVTISLLGVAAQNASAPATVAVVEDPTATGM